jgi:surface carbohydrate biosynthesis protein
MKKDIDIVIFIEHKDRELQLSIELKKVLEKNHSVIIASLIYHTHIILSKYNVKTIVTPFIGFGKGSISDLFYKVYGDKINYININYEQFLFPFTGEFKVPKTKASKEIQINLAWGKHFKEYLINAGAKEKNIFVTGRPYSQLIKKINNKEEQLKSKLSTKYGLNISKKWIFIALTDGLAFRSDESLNNLVAFGGQKDDMLAQVAHDRLTIDKLIKLLSKIDDVNVFEEFEFILRPHPSVSIDEYLKVFEKNKVKIPKKLKIIKGNTALDWLVSSEYLITNYSTLIIDANVINKKILVFNHDDKFSYLWWVKFANGFFYNLSEIEELLNLKKIDTIQNFDDYYIENKNGVLESAKIINLKTDRINYSRFNNFTVFKKVFFKKRFLAIIYRYTLMSLFKNPFNLIKKGLAVDYFNINDINNK